MRTTGLAQVAVSAPGYGRGAIGFHWSMVVLVVAVGTLGLLHNSWPRSTHQAP